MIDITRLEIDKLLELNASLSRKKNGLRKDLANKGVLEKDRKNDYDRYTYFSEAAYKKLFTELFSSHGLELTTTRKNVEEISGTDKQPFGRRVTLKFTLTDTDTGYFEESEFDGEGLDKGDKALYKAYTGALKYYLASTFNVATGDDAESESPEGRKSAPPTRHPQKQEQRQQRMPKTQERPQETPNGFSQKKINDIQNRQINAIELEALEQRIKTKGVRPDPQKLYGAATYAQMTFGQWKQCMETLDKLPDKQTKQMDLGL